MAGQRHSWKPAGLATAFDLAAFRLSMIAPVKKSVNHSRTVASMRETGWEQHQEVRLRSDLTVWSEFGVIFILVSRASILLVSGGSKLWEREWVISRWNLHNCEGACVMRRGKLHHGILFALGGRWQFSFFFSIIITRGSRLFSFLEWSYSLGVFNFHFPFCTSGETDFSVSTSM